MRDDFNTRTKDTLARRAGMRCSNPTCRKPTSGPHTKPEKSVNIGIATHIRAASVGGPRYDSKSSAQERKSIKNGIWLCQNCAKLVDNDFSAFTVKELKRWKRLAEGAARLEVEHARSSSSESHSRARMSSSIRELISLVDLRASLILQEMERGKKRAEDLFKKHSKKSAKLKPRSGPAPTKISSSGNEEDPHEIFDHLLRSERASPFDDLDRPLVMWHRLWNIDSQKELCLQLDSLRHSFLELHKLYKSKLLIMPHLTGSH